MVMGAADGAAASMLSIVPVVVTGGILMKFTDSMMSKTGQMQQPTQKRQLRRSPAKKNVYSREYNGRFANVGF